MQFILTIDSDDAHAAEDPRGLVTDALGDISKLVEVGLDRGPIRDANGNRVGEWSLTESGPRKLGRSTSVRLG